MKTRIFLTLVLSLIYSSVSFSQKMNGKGQKMVKSLTVRFFASNGELVESWNRDILYIYNEKNELVGVNNTYKEQGNIYIEKYEKVTEPQGVSVIYGCIYKNNKLLPKNKIKIGFKFRIYDYPMDDYTMRKETYRYYTSRVTQKIYRVERNEYGTFRDDDSMDYSYNRFKEDDYSKKAPHLSYDEVDYGFTNSLLPIYVTKDGTKYYKSSVEPENVTELSFINGDMQNCLEVWDDEIRCENVYSDRENDTNIEFYGFSRGGFVGSPYANIEWSTEWMQTQSRHLLLMEARNYRFGKSKEEWVKEKYPDRYNVAYKSETSLCKAKWDYRFDSSGNIKQILVHRYGNILEKWECVIDIDYVY